MSGKNASAPSKTAVPWSWYVEECVRCRADYVDPVEAPAASEQGLAAQTGKIDAVAAKPNNGQ
jgi:hypothetical protein